MKDIFRETESFQYLKKNLNNSGLCIRESLKKITHNVSCSLFCIFFYYSSNTLIQSCFRFQTLQMFEKLKNKR